MREIRVIPDVQTLSRVAAEELVTQARDAVHARGVFHVALSGGATPLGTYTRLATDDALRQKMPWAQTHFWWSDERHVPPAHADSNFRAAHEAMLARVQLPAQNIHRIRAENPDAAQAAQDYEAELRAVFQLDAPALPRFDLILLGIGSDGHTASLFPGTKALNETQRLVVRNWVGKLYTWRITFTAPLINTARGVMFLAAGDDKALPLKGVLEGPYEPVQLPAQLIQPREGKLIWLLDFQAAGELSPAIKNP
ncbi:MAG: 6-phosphogluconolactonase [Chloroflexi bacterium]|nr:6-phosphogluconolactonase [Chloroflexota bacterium]